MNTEYNPFPWIIAIGLLALAALGVSCSSVTTIDAGQRGVKKVWGEVTGAPLTEGIYFNSPFSTNVVKYDTRTQLRENSTTAYTRDVQQAVITYTIGFAVRPDAVGQVEVLVGSDWANLLLMDLVPDSIKNVVGKWEAVDLVANRDKLSPQVLTSLRERLAEKAKARGLPEDVVQLSSFAFANVDFADEFERAVESKVVAVQRAEESKNTTVRIEEEAKQKVIAAQAEAESMRIRAEALNQNKGLVEYEAVQKWDGVLPTQMLGTAPMPFLNLTK